MGSYAEQHNGRAHVEEFERFRPETPDVVVSPEPSAEEETDMPARKVSFLESIRPSGVTIVFWLISFVFSAGIFYKSSLDSEARRAQLEAKLNQTIEDLNKTRAEMAVAQDRIANLRAASDVRKSLETLEQAQTEQVKMLKELLRK